MKVACMLDAGTYKPGDPPPAGYVQWHEWAETQHKAGLRQKQCGRCGLWRFPQELSDATIRYTAQSRKGPATLIVPVCKKCNPDGVPVAGKVVTVRRRGASTTEDIIDADGVKTGGGTDGR